MGRSPSCSHDGLKKGPWTAEEDQVLTEYIQNHGGHGSWRTLPKRAGLNRCGKSCRLRWNNYLRPDIKRGNFDQEEKQLIINLHSALGNKWSQIAARLPGRTDNEIKNFWNTHLRRKLVNNGIDPKTRKPIHDPNFLVNLYQLILQSATSNLTNLMAPLNYGALELKPHLAQPAADIQVMQNLWQFIDSTSSYNLSQFDGLINGTSSAPYGMNSNNTYQVSSTFLNMRDCPQIANEDLVFPNSAASFGGQFSPEVFQNNMNCLLSNNEYCSAQRENLLPALEMPEISTVKETTSESINPACFPTDTSSNIFETLEKLVDDFEDSTSFWNDTIIT